VELTVLNPLVWVSVSNGNQNVE
jgi:hypothetical protein